MILYLLLLLLFVFYFGMSIVVGRISYQLMKEHGPSYVRNDPSELVFWTLIKGLLWPLTLIID